MKRTSLKALASIVAGVALFAGGRSLLAQSAPIGNSVGVSKHNLNNVYGTNTIHNNYGTSQVCLPCHTPHQMPAQNVTDNLGKLWNHTLNPASSYTLNGTSSSYLSSIDEVSRKCLGCHDGTIAVDSFGSSPAASTTGTLASDNLGAGTAGFVIGPGGDLRHDHPIDVLYNGASRYLGVSTQGSSGTFTYTTAWNNTSTNDPSTFTINGFVSSKWAGTGTDTHHLSTNYTVPALSAINFYRPSGSTQSVTVRDANPGTGTGSTATPVNNGDGTYTHTISVQSQYVYCRSCHDPHNNLYNFLRVPNDNSQLCFTCHNK
jgi:predicted CXXCH cytochrome family protein